MVLGSCSSVVDQTLRHSQLLNDISHFPSSVTFPLLRKLFKPSDAFGREKKSVLRPSNTFSFKSLQTSSTFNSFPSGVSLSETASHRALIASVESFASGHAISTRPALGSARPPLLITHSSSPGRVFHSRYQGAFWMPRFKVCA